MLWLALFIWLFGYLVFAELMAYYIFPHRWNAYKGWDMVSIRTVRFVAWPLCAVLATFLFVRGELNPPTPIQEFFNNART